MPLANAHGVVTVVAQDAGERCCSFWNAPAVSGKGKRCFLSCADTDGMMIATSEERSASRLANRRDVKAIESNAAFGQRINVWCVDKLTETAQLPKTNIVEHDYHHVGRIGWRGRIRNEMGFDRTRSGHWTIISVRG